MQKKRIIILAAVMVLAVVLVGGVTMSLLYRTAIAQQTARLQDTAVGRARVIESIARFNSSHEHDYPGGSDAATLDLITDAHARFEGFGETGEFCLARREGDSIVFLIHHRHEPQEEPAPTPFDSPLAEPMRRALLGQSGTMTGLDHHGVTVLAAYEPVDWLGTGVVTKIDMVEVNAPFIAAAWISAAVMAVVVTLGIVTFFRVSNPLLRRLEEHARDLEAEVEERSRAERELQFLANIMEQVSDSVTVMDTDYRIMYVNTAMKALYGYDEAELIGRSPEFLNAEPPAEGTQNAVYQAVSAGDTWLGTLENKRKDGSTFDCELKVSPTYDRDAQITGYIGVQRDVTERRLTAEREKELQQEIIASGRLASVGEMAAGIAHEINNPLTGVIGYSDILMRKDIPEDIKREAGFIHDGAQRIAGIVRRMLTYARQHAPERADADINDILKATLEMQSHAMRSGGVEVMTQLDRDIPAMPLDAGQIQQVFLNIILNAQYEMADSHGGGTLLVKTERVNDTIRVSFKDDGPGIAAQNLTKVFEPFFTTREVGQGAGLGLSVSHGIVKQHGGTIRVESELGKGATFTVELPIATREEQMTPTELPPEAAETLPASVLIVDDEPMIRQYLKDVLGEAGHSVRTAANGEEGLKRLDSEHFDVILLDIKLPGMSGIDFYKQLQKQRKSEAKRVVFITGDVMTRDTMTFLSRTKAPHLAKPFGAEELKKTLNRILAGEA